MKKLYVFHISAALMFAATSSTSTPAIESDKHFSFSHPSNWNSDRDKENSNCQFLKSNYPTSAAQWDLKICKYSGLLEEILKFTVFMKTGDKWMAAGSMDQQPAAWKSTGIDSISIETIYPPTCGVADSYSGFHAAGGQCYSALIGCKKDYVLVESNGLNTDFSAMRKITRSVIFKECRKSSKIKIDKK